MSKEVMGRKEIGREREEKIETDGKRDIALQRQR
jgi:hypothetical protein